MSLKPENPSKDVNILKRKPKNAEMEEEIQLKQDLIPSKKRLLAEDRPSKSKIIPNQNIDYEESFKKHLGKQAELQKNIELFTKNVEDKILYDKGFSNMLQEMVMYLETNNEENLNNYHKLIKENQQFLMSKSKETSTININETEKTFKTFIEADLSELELKELKLKETIKELEESLEKEELLSQEKELEIYKEMTNLTLEVVKNPENLDIYEGEIKSFVNSERFLRFQLIFNQENEEIQYVPLKINIDVQNNHELEEEMFFDASQTDHFMALIYKLVNKDLN